MSELEEKITLSEELEEILLNTREQGQLIEQLIKNQIKVKDAQISSLHEELEYYRRDEAGRYVENVMKSIIKIRKQMGRRLAENDFEQMSQKELQREYQYIFEDLTDLLEQNNIDAYSTLPGELFDASIHQPVIENTSNPMLDKQVKESIQEGYRKKDRVINPEKVVIYRYFEDKTTQG